MKIKREKDKLEESEKTLADDIKSNDELKTGNCEKEKKICEDRDQ